MSSFTKFEAKKLDTVGFVVEDTWNGGVYYVEVDRLFLSNVSVMLKDEYVAQDQEWYEQMFSWGVPRGETFVKKFRQLNINEVSEVPDWVSKGYEVVKEEMAALRKEIFKKSWTYKITHLFAKKGDK